MKFNPYEDAKKKLEVVQVKYDLGKSNSQIAEEMGISRASVSYYLKKLGVSRTRVVQKDGKACKVCIVCFMKPPADALQLVCTSPICLNTFMQTMLCEHSITARFSTDNWPVPVDSATKIALDIQKYLSFRAPEDARVCVLHSVTKLLASLADHIRFHAYHLVWKHSSKKRRPPAVLWRDDEEQKRQKLRKEEEDFLRRNENSEDLLSRRIR
jgi:hypothetical protein